MEAPLVIMPRGWTPASRTIEARDKLGRRVKFVVKTHQDTGRIGGNSYGPSYEHHLPDDRVAAKVRPTTVRRTVRASDLGMNVRQLRDFWIEMERRFPFHHPTVGRTP